MHDIEPFYNWRDRYIAAEDDRSPFYGREYDELRFTQKVYNYYIHPQWDDFGSSTLYAKVLYADYDENFAIIELIGEWNDCLYNDIMHLKRELIDATLAEGIDKYIIMCENVFNFHGDDDSYYEEWYEDVNETGGWVIFLNLLQHVEDEMKDTRLGQYVNFGEPFNDINWRPQKPRVVFHALEALLQKAVKRLS